MNPRTKMTAIIAGGTAAIVLLIWILALAFGGHGTNTASRSNPSVLPTRTFTVTAPVDGAPERGSTDSTTQATEAPSTTLVTLPNGTVTAVATSVRTVNRTATAVRTANGTVTVTVIQPGPTQTTTATQFQTRTATVVQTDTVTAPPVTQTVTATETVTNQTTICIDLGVIVTCP